MAGAITTPGIVRRTLRLTLQTARPHWDGGLAKYIIIPEEVLKVDGLNPIADHVPFAEASVAEPFACALNAEELANVGEGDVVAVVGARPIGCIHVRLARARGAKEVHLIELSRERLDLSAERVRPDEVICAAEADPVADVARLTDGRGVDVVGASGSSPAHNRKALECIASEAVPVADLITDRLPLEGSSRESRP